MDKQKEIKRMGFSQRLKVVEEYYLWKRQEENENKFSMIDNHETFLAFLEIKGYCKAEPIKDDMIHFDERLEIANNASKKTAEKILQKLYDDCFKVNTHIKKVYDSRLPLVGFCDDDIYREIKKLAEEYGVKVGGNGGTKG